jgi:hypothetical protein
MEHETHEFRLCPEELDYLRRTFSRDGRCGSMIRRWSSETDRTPVIRLSRDDVERLRGRLTERLAEVGLDKDYDLTPEGQLLEDLIDKFWLPPNPR